MNDLQIALVTVSVFAKSVSWRERNQLRIIPPVYAYVGCDRYERKLKKACWLSYTLFAIFTCMLQLLEILHFSVTGDARYFVL